MLRTKNSEQNRLLALDQTLLGWKQSAHVSRGESPQTENGHTPPLSDCASRSAEGNRLVEPEDIWEDENENEWIADDAADLSPSAVASSELFSYSALANRLESRAKGLAYSSIRQQMQLEETETEEETDDTFFEPFFFSDSRAGSTSVENQSVTYQTPITSPSHWRQASMPESAAFSVPEIDLPDADLPDSISVASTGFSDDGSSYRSLFQVIQSARQGDSTADSEDEPFSTAQTTHTIDVEAQAIAESQNN